MQKIIDRFDKYMKTKGLNDNKVTNELKLSVGVLGKSRKEGRDLSRNIIEMILNHYTELNSTWLLTGEGHMLRSETNNQINSSMEDKERLGILEESIAILKKELSDKQKTIYSLNESNQKLISFVTGSQELKKKEAV